MGNEESSPMGGFQGTTYASANPINTSQRSRRPSSRAPATKREILDTFQQHDMHNKPTKTEHENSFIPPPQYMGGLKRTKSDIGVDDDVIDALSNKLGSRRVSITNDDDDDQISRVVAEAAARMNGKADKVKLERIHENGPPAIKKNMSNLLNKKRSSATDSKQKITRKMSNIVTSRRSEPPSTGNGHQWSSKEEAVLEQLHAKYGPNWQLICRHMPGRSETQCQNRWNRMLKPGIRKGTWTTEEDAKLVELVNGMPKRNWGDISSLIEGRSAKQCRERWCYNLDPSINKNVWTPAEDQILTKAQSELGNRWAHIASLLPGRTENAVKTRFKSIMRAIKREWSPAEDEIILKMHQQLGSRWDTIAARLPNRTKNAVKTRFRVLGKGKANTKPEVGAPNQSLHRGVVPDRSLAELTKLVSQEHKHKANNIMKFEQPKKKSGSTRKRNTKKKTELASGVLSSLRGVESPHDTTIDDVDVLLGNDNYEYRRYGDDLGFRSLLGTTTHHAQHNTSHHTQGHVAEVAAAAAAAAQHNTTLLARMQEDNIDDGGISMIHPGQQVDDELIDFLDMWNQESANIEGTIM